jgi:hypothetical protein
MAFLKYEVFVKEQWNVPNAEGPTLSAATSALSIQR